MRDTATFPAPSGGAASAETTFWNWQRILVAGFLTLVVMALGVGLGIYASWSRSGQIAPGLIVQGEPLGGLSPAVAQERLEQRFGRLFVTLETPNRPYVLALKQLGCEVLVEDAVNAAYAHGRSGNFVGNAWNYWTSQKIEERRALPVRWDKDQLRQTMWTVATQYRRSPRDAELRVTSAGIQVVPERNGRSLNVGETCAVLQRQYFAGKPEIKAVTRTQLPRLVATELAGRDVQLGKYTTSFNAGLRGRTTNIELSSDALNGKVLMPNEQFSFNAITGQRTTKKGYRIAHIFVRKPGQTESEIVDGVGGGICQVSSTLYNAVRVTNNQTQGRLTIVERNNHSLPVTYVPPGLDATVAWPSKDFRFRNTFAHPVYIRSHTAGSRLTIELWGRVPEDVQSVTLTDESTQASTPSTDSPA